MSDLPPYAHDSDTSKAAAESMAPHTARLRALIFYAIKAKGQNGMTCDEIVVAHKIIAQTASARINELHNGASIMDSGERRKTVRKRDAAVYVAVKDTPEWARIPPPPAHEADVVINGVRLRNHLPATLRVLCEQMVENLSDPDLGCYDVDDPSTKAFLLHAYEILNLIHQLKKPKKRKPPDA